MKHGSYHEPSGHFYKIPEKPEPPPPATLQGKPIGSVHEWRFALALMYYKLEFMYQLDINGGRTRRGGQVLDFMVLTRPLYTPVHIVGLYWHDQSNKLDDELRRYSLMDQYRGQIREPVYVYDTDIPNLDAAYQIVKKEMITG
jgi:hypothetical protein